MLIYKNVDELKNRINKNKKGQRILEAIFQNEKIYKNVFYNIGDSLVFMKTDINLELDYFVSHKVYLDILYIDEGTIEIEYSNKNNLKKINEYSQEEDETRHIGKGEKIVLDKGNIVVFNIEDAYKVTKDESLRKTIIKFTKENEIF